jgi:hypothetical protein
MGPNEVVKTDHSDWKTQDAIVGDGACHFLSDSASSGTLKLIASASSCSSRLQVRRFPSLYCFLLPTLFPSLATDSTASTTLILLLLPVIPSLPRTHSAAILQPASLPSPLITLNPLSTRLPSTLRPRSTTQSRHTFSLSVRMRTCRKGEARRASR